MAVTVILSPHQDDAVFSLWHVLSGPGEVRVVNVFAGAPASERLGWWDAETGASDPASRALERGREDRAALGLAGRSSVNLDFVDAQYRDGEPPTEAIAAALGASVPDEALLLAPAGLGGHADHRLVRSAALSLRETGRRLALYADIPHATRHGWPGWVTNGQHEREPQEPSEAWRADLDGSGIALGELVARVHSLDDREAQGKATALAEYRTQLPALDVEFSLSARPEALRYEIVWQL
ncbi:MAG: PIG-L deacetylase family protein [Solirubrobacterales bacterium]